MRSSTLFRKYDVAATTYVYPVFADPKGVVGGIPILGARFGGRQVKKPVTNVVPGTASVNVVALTAGSAPFGSVALGDLLIFGAVPTFGAVPLTWTREERVVTTRTDADTIVVDSSIAIPAAGMNFTAKTRFVGVVANKIDGWISVGDFLSFAVELNLDTLNGTNVTYIVEGLYNRQNQEPVQIATAAMASAPLGAVVTVAYPNPYEYVRVGLKVVGDSGVQSISGFLTGVLEDPV